MAWMMGRFPCAMHRVCLEPCHAHDNPSGLCTAGGFYKNMDGTIALTQTTSTSPAPSAATVVWGPVLTGDSWAWQTVHASLMMAAFCLFMPLAVLLARHKYLFGHNNKVRPGDACELAGSVTCDKAMNTLLAVAQAIAGDGSA